jgi:regulator of sirC expression with transglutaminase-like and TPR domain
MCIAGILASMPVIAAEPVSAQKMNQQYYRELAENPFSDTALQGLATYHYRHSEWNQSLKYLDRLLQHTSNNAQALLLRAKIYYHQGKPYMALADLHRVTDHENDFIDAYMLMEGIYTELGDAKTVESIKSRISTIRSARAN